MLQLRNDSPFAAAMAVLPDTDGIDTLYVIVKATINLLPRLSLAATQLQVNAIDEYYEDPASSSLKNGSEMHLSKPGTDVLLVGCARAPQGELTESCLISVSVAERSKRICVLGDRVWRSDGTPSAPQPFEAMPLVWERAFGGTCIVEDEVFAEERNPIGCGFRGKRPEEEMIGQPVPNLEDPSLPIGNWNATPAPACFAPIAPSWLPRRAFVGTYDAAWERTRAPYLPRDFDSRFFQCATPELSFERHLQGGELVQLEGMSEVPLAFALPATRPALEVSVAGALHQPELKLETLWLEPDQNRAALTWRASLPCDRQVLKIEQVHVALRRTALRSV